MASNILELGITFWKNGLGSHMKLISDGKGHLTGTYLTKVGDADGPMPLLGQYNPCEDCPSLGWVVQWKPECNSVRPQGRGWSTTAWSGQVSQKTDGSFIIDAKWLLTMQTPLLNSWEDTLIGCGLFTQQSEVDAPSL